jgi:hypothetical protein
MGEMPPSGPGMHGLDERHNQGKMTRIDEEHRGIAPGARRAAGSHEEGRR